MLQNTIQYKSKISYTPTNIFIGCQIASIIYKYLLLQYRKDLVHPNRHSTDEVEGPQIITKGEGYFVHSCVDAYSNYVKLGGEGRGDFNLEIYLRIQKC